MKREIFNKDFLKLLPLETKRLIIKKATITDVNLILKMDKQEITQKYLGGIKRKTKEERLAFLNKKINKFKNGSSLTVFLKDNTPIGFVEIMISDNYDNATLSYMFDYDYCNKGYCTEACKKIIDIAFNNLNIKSILADTALGNNSSIKVLEKLGFKFQKRIKKNNEDFLYYIIYNNK